MLQAAANLAPRGVYVCGNTTSTAGLTVSLSKETGSGDFALEAGALVLADQGQSACYLFNLLLFTCLVCCCLQGVVALMSLIRWVVNIMPFWKQW